MATPKGLVRQLQDAVAASGLTSYRIAKDTGLSERTVARALNGWHTPTIENAETILDYLGYRVRIVKKGAGR